MGCICASNTGYKFEITMEDPINSKNKYNHFDEKIQKSELMYDNIHNQMTRTHSEKNSELTKVTHQEETIMKAKAGNAFSPIEFSNMPFKMQVFEKINDLRTDPKSFSQIVEKYIETIHSDIQKRNHYLEKNDNKVVDRVILKKGAMAFNDCITFLQGIYPLEPLEYKEDLEVPIEEVDPLLWTKRGHITTLLQNKSSQLANSYSGFGFHFDVNIKDPELSIVQQVVDDGNFYGQRRSNILSHKFKYVGISHSNLKDTERFCIYFNFAY